MRRRTMLALTAGLCLTAAGVLGATGLASWAEEENNPAELAAALGGAKLPLEQGLKAGAREGTPISGKYEIEDDALQLSVYTMKGNQFSEVIVDHMSGAIRKAERITESEDLSDAKAQSEAIAKAKLPLDQAVASAVQANDGYRAVKVVAMLKDGAPVAEITLMKNAEVKTVTEKLD